jgi:KaiC/GvpD/RAD55 family RecA-like ATPase
VIVTATPAKNVVKTGIPGFDGLIEKGGIPEGTAVLVSGGPGTGKTTFCLQTLCYGASQGEKCLYLSFEENVQRLKQHMKGFGYDPDSLESKGFLVIRRIDPFEISRSVEALLAKARGELMIEIDEVEALLPPGFVPERIVLDSLSAVSAAFAGREEGYRIYIEQLFKALEKIGATSFLITEINLDLNKFSRSGVEEFLSDGVIAFYNIRKGNTRISATEIVKMRGTAHKKKIVPFTITAGKGIEVYPSEEIFAEQEMGSLG